MLYLQELLDDLSYGETSGLAVTNPITDTDIIKNHARIFSLINNGLLDLYTRFKIKEKEFDLYQRADKSLYYVRAAYLGDPGAGDSEVYIDGTGDDPPAGDIIRFLEAYDADGVEVRINNPKYPYDIFTYEPDVIKLVQEEDADLRVISLVYQAAYPKINIEDDEDPETYALYFPTYLKKALLLSIAATLYRGKSSKASEQGNLSNTYLYQYELEINKIKELGLLPDKTSTSTNFEMNGWI